MKKAVLFLRERKWLQFLIFFFWELLPNADFYYHLAEDVNWEIVRTYLPMFVMTTIAGILLLLYVNALANYYISENKLNGEIDESTIDEIIENIELNIRKSGFTKVQVLLSTGSNAGSFALNLQRILKEKGYDTEEIDSLMFVGPTDGISYGTYEGRVRVVLGMLR